MQDDMLEYIEYSFNGIKVSCDDYDNKHSGYLKNDICKKICELKQIQDIDILINLLNHTEIGIVPVYGTKRMLYVTCCTDDKKAIEFIVGQKDNKILTDDLPLGGRLIDNIDYVFLKLTDILQVRQAYNRILNSAITTVAKYDIGDLEKLN